jgi:hypothetical protein
LPGGHTINTTAVTIASTASTITTSGQLFHQLARAGTAVPMRPVGRGGRTGLLASYAFNPIDAAACGAGA